MPSTAGPRFWPGWLQSISEGPLPGLVTAPRDPLYSLLPTFSTHLPPWLLDLVRSSKGWQPSSSLGLWSWNGSASFPTATGTHTGFVTPTHGPGGPDHAYLRSHPGMSEASQKLVTEDGERTCLREDGPWVSVSELESTSPGMGIGSSLLYADSQIPQTQERSQGCLYLSQESDLWGSSFSSPMLLGDLFCLKFIGIIS